LRYDLQKFRNSQEGFGAPLVCKSINGKRVYVYDDKKFSITQLPLLAEEDKQLDIARQILERYGSNSNFDILNESLATVDDNLQSLEYPESQPIIFHDTNKEYIGLKYVSTLYDAVKNKRVLELTYKTFYQKEAITFEFHPLF
jgi:hypothetical protein